jgi:hypothetical protein
MLAVSITIIICLIYRPQMFLSKSKCWYSSNCLHCLKCAVPLAGMYIPGLHFPIRLVPILCLLSLPMGGISCSFCHQLAALFPRYDCSQDMFCNFSLVKNHKIDKNSVTAQAREKISTIRNSYDFLMNVCLN